MRNKKNHLALKIYIFMLSLLLSSTATLLAQEKIVNGVVSSAEEKDALIGVSVVEKGTINGVVTDHEGKFQIKTQGANPTLVFSLIGMETAEISAKNKNYIEVELKDQDLSLDEVVVTGYTTQKKADLTGSIAVVSVEDLKTSPDTDPFRALQGRVPGVNITANGSPSGVGTIRIRGIGSLASNTDPLFVIDGVPTTSNLNTLNTNDIESMQILKDGASASIYGSRAANGVIIITTKKGKSNNKINVSVKASVTAQFNSSPIDVLDADQYGKVLVQAALNDKIDPIQYAKNYGYTVSGTGSNLSDYSIARGIFNNGYLNSTETMRASNTDWFDEVSRTGIIQNYDMSISSANEKGSKFFSLGYKDNNGIHKHTSFNALSMRLNSTYNINKYITVGENYTLSYSTKVVSPGVMTTALKIPSILPVYEEDGKTFGGPIGSMPDRQNPVRQLYHNRDNKGTTWRSFGNGYIDVKPIKGLVLRSNFGLDYESFSRRDLTYSFMSDILQNKTPEVDIINIDDLKWTWTNTANYNLDILKAHKFSFLIGNELFKQTYLNIKSNKKEFDVENPDYMWPDSATGESNITGAETGYALASFFGKVDYSFRNKYLASFTIRYDGSSRFGRNNRYATFPAATLGWRMTSESFMASTSSWLDDLKLRASWGKNGNQAISNTARYGIYVADYGRDRMTSTAYDLYMQGSGIFPSGYRTTQTQNNDLKWEAATQYNAGLDFTMLSQSVYGVLDVYKKDVKDMLISPAFLGAIGEGGNSWHNGPSLVNKGIEFMIGYRKRITKDLNIDINANIDKYTNKVTSLPVYATGAYEHTNSETLIGRAYGSRVGYVCEGIFQTEEEVKNSGQKNARVGGLKYANLDDDPNITDNDRTWILDPIPAFSYGINISAVYKDFDFSMFWQGVHDVDVLNGRKTQTDFWSVSDVGSNKGTRLLNAWSPENTSSKIPALTTNNTSDEGRMSTYLVEDGSYLKLRSLQIGYNLPRQIAKKIYSERIRFYASGQNFLTIKSSSFTGKDPENPAWGYPIPKSFTFGMQIDF